MNLKQRELAKPVLEPSTRRFARGTAALADDVVTISRDLKGPISVIAREVALLEETLPAATTTRSALGRIARNLTYLDNLLHDLLDLSAIEASRFAIHTEPTELCGLVAEVIERTVSSSHRERISVTTSGTMMVMADRRRIERVVSNLVQNALKHTLLPERIDVLVERRGDRARVTVNDAGPGILPEEVSRLFEEFRRGPGAARNAGIGLGLYVSRTIIEAHGGKIGVDSVLGQGSRFHVTLPLIPRG